MFKSIKDASNIVFGKKYSIRAISQCCKGQKDSYGGFKWKQIENIVYNKDEYSKRTSV